MGVDDLQRVLAGMRLVALDTMIFSYQLADHPRYAPLTTAVLGAIETGRLLGLTTTVTLAEILTVPAKVGDRQALQDYELYLTRFPNLEIIPLDVALARETGLVRGQLACARRTRFRQRRRGWPGRMPLLPMTGAGWAKRWG